MDRPGPARRVVLANVTAMARRNLLAVVIVGALAVSACTRPEDAISAESSMSPVTEPGDGFGTNESADDADGPQATTDTTEVAPATTSTTTTTEVSDTDEESTEATEAPATTTATTPDPPDDPSDLTLIFDGVLPFRFGDRDVDVVPALTELLGSPTLDELHEFPNADQGVFFDATGEESFVARVGRTVCFPNSLCVQFGAGAPETLILTGWRVDERSELTTDDGIAIGSTLADFADVITFDPAVSCFQVAFGTAAGIDVTLLSEDGPFASPNSDGDGLVIGDPDPALVTVIEMRAGQLPVFVFADC